MIALILDDEEKNYNKVKKKWIRKMFTMRKSIGEYYTLFKELEDEEISFYTFFKCLKSVLHPFI